MKTVWKVRRSLTLPKTLQTAGSGWSGFNPSHLSLDIFHEQQMDNICLQNGGGNGNRTVFVVPVCFNRVMLRFARAFQQASFCILRRQFFGRCSISFCFEIQLFTIVEQIMWAKVMRPLETVHIQSKKYLLQMESLKERRQSGESDVTLALHARHVTGNYWTDSLSWTWRWGRCTDTRLEQGPLSNRGTQFPLREPWSISVPFLITQTFALLAKT